MTPLDGGNKENGDGYSDIGVSIGDVRDGDVGVGVRGDVDVGDVHLKWSSGPARPRETLQ